MKTTVKFPDFCEAFNRADRADNFTRDGLRILFDYIEEHEQSTGEEIELDVVALCCEFDEMTASDVAKDYDIEADGDDLEDAVRDYLEYNTILCGEYSDGDETVFVFSAF